MKNRFLYAFTAFAISWTGSASEVRPKVVLDDNLGRDIAAWTIDNYKDRLQIRATNFCGEACAYVTLTNENCTGPWSLDTSFAFKSRRVPVRGDDDFILSVRSRGTYSLRFARGAQSTCVRWFGADGKALGEPTDCAFDVLSNRWYTARLQGRVPVGATAAEVTVGADQPNVRTRQFVAISDVSLATCPHGAVKIEVERPEEIYGLPPTPEELAYPRQRIDSNGFVLVDGKPFFPIGIYGFEKNAFNGNDFDRGLKDLKEAGFNLVQNYKCTRDERFAEFLDAADRQGMRVLVFPGGPTTYQTDLEKTIAAEKHHPCLLTWYLADDTSDCILPVGLRALTARCHAADPTRLTSQADAVGSGNLSKYRPFVDATDIYLPEVYPVCRVQPTGLEVPKVILDMTMIADDLARYPGRRRSVWPIIQHFDGWKAWERFPTLAELRAMSYQAVIHGANGIMWYTYIGAEKRGRGVTSSPERWREITSVSRELAALSDDLVCANASVQPSVEIVSGPARDLRGFPAVSVLLKDSPRGRLLLAGNSSTNGVRARISVAGCRTAEVLFEDARKLAAAPVLEDDFPPLGVHVYRLER